VEPANWLTKTNRRYLDKTQQIRILVAFLPFTTILDQNYFYRISHSTWDEVETPKQSPHFGGSSHALKPAKK
jgi:hypothetical protein